MIEYLYRRDVADLAAAIGGTVAELLALPGRKLDELLAIHEAMTERAKQCQR